MLEGLDVDERNQQKGFCIFCAKTEVSLEEILLSLEVFLFNHNQELVIILTDLVHSLSI